MLNLTAMTGRLVDTPELRRTKQGEVPVTSFRVAVRHDFVRNGDDDTDFFDVVAWRGTAEFICNYFKKGSLIQLTGRMQNRKWKDSHDQSRVTAELIADRAYFGDSKDKGGTADIDPLGDDSESSKDPDGVSLPANIDPFAE